MSQHRRVESVKGPRFCCQDCSTDAKRYVEWPCPSRMLMTYALLGRLMQEATRKDATA